MSFLFQKSPEVSSPSSSLDEALTFHGLTRDKMTTEVIRWMESIRLENPSAYHYLSSDPSIIAPYIIKWDFVFSTGMLTDYPERRNWTHWMAFREFIQNALDVEEKKFGYDHIAIKVFKDSLGVHIVDRGSGITLEAFKLGGSDKGCEERGYFGEGLKVAAAHLAGYGSPVYIFNRQGQAFKLCLSPGTRLLVVVMGRAKYPPAGTEVIFYAANIPPDIMERTVFQEWMKAHPEVTVVEEKIFSSPQCKISKPNIIVKGVENVDILWVRDILVNTISTITRKTAIFGYNLWWVPLDPNRVTVASQTDLAVQAAKTYTPESILTLLPEIVKSHADYAETSKGFFETDIIDWWHASDEVKESVAKWVKDEKLAVTTNEKAVEWVKYMGVMPLIVKTDTLSPLFSYAPKAEERVLEKAVDRLKLGDSTSIPEEALSLKELSNLGACKAVLTYVQRSSFYHEKLPDIKVAKSLAEANGIQTAGTIYIRRLRLRYIDEAFSTLYHEYCHYYGKAYYGKAPDLSEAFQTSLTDVSGMIAGAFTDYRLVETYRRALNGGWKANIYEWKIDHYVVKPRLMDVILDTMRSSGYMISWGGDWAPLFRRIEAEAPIWVLVSAHNSKIEPSSFKYSINNVKSVIPEDFPPSEELYRKKVGEVIDKLSIPPAHGIIFMYNPWRDTYEVHRSF